jgi:hypothetical protein
MQDADGRAVERVEGIVGRGAALHALSAGNRHNLRW